MAEGHPTVEDRNGRTNLPVRRREFIVGGSALGMAGCTGDLIEDAELPSTLDPPALLLTWQDDPTTTMTVDWHTAPDDDYTPRLQYRNAEETDWHTVEAETHEFEHYEREIHRVTLTGLTPDTSYEFRMGQDPRFRFRTLPAELDDELLFAIGGDSDGAAVDSSDWADVAEQLMEYDLAFFVIAGDLAYADGGARSNDQRRWANWLDVVKTQLIDDDGRVVPIIAGIGNHECVDGYYFAAADYEDSDEWRESFAPYFYNFFAFPGHPGYGVMDIGDYLSIPILDTDHTNPVGGDQTEWLADVLSERSDREHVIPIYHVPGWPSERSFDGRTEREVREQWVPLFETHGVRWVFEHHDHAHKLTYPLRDGEIDPTGIVYVGDGPLGYSERDPGLDRWYLNRTKARYNGDVVRISPGGVEVTAVDIHGKVLYERQRTDETFQITHYPRITFEYVGEVIHAGDSIGVRTAVYNESPVSMTDLSFELEGNEYAFDFETEDETTLAALDPGDRHRLRWDGHAPDIEEELEVLTRVTFTVDGDEREEVRSDWVPIGW